MASPIEESDLRKSCEQEAHEAERAAWETLCNDFERLTGESLGDPNAGHQYCALASILRVWAERSAIRGRVDSNDSAPAPIRRSCQLEERQAYAAVDQFIDRVASENWGSFSQNQAWRNELLTTAAGIWCRAMVALRQAQGTDGDKWGANTLQYESAKLQRMGLPT